MNVEKIIRRFKSAEVASGNFRGMYERSYELAAPNHNSYERSPGSNKAPRVYDSTPAMAMDSFVNTMMNTVTPTHTRWASLEAGVGLPSLFAAAQGLEDPTKEDLDEIRNEINDQLGEATENLFAYLNASNLYSALGSMYYDVGVGTGCMLAMPGDERLGIGSPLNFRAIPPSAVSLEEGAYGEISSIFRKIRGKKRDLEVEWKDLKSLGSGQGEDDDVILIEATMFNPKTGLWDYFVVFEENRVVVKRTYKSNPWIIFRWNVIPGEIWGRGPMIKALPDAQQLNAAKQLSIRASQLSAFGAYTGISDDIINPNSVRIIPGAIIPVRRNAGPSGPSIAALPGIGNINAQVLMITELQGNIRRMLLDENLPGPESGPMSATEVVERVRKIQRDFGAIFGRITYELLQPIIQRSLDILVDRGLMALPSFFTSIDSFTVKMKVISPLARLQSMQDVESMTQVIQILGSISPELVPQQIKLDILGDWLADKLGAPNKFIKSREEMEQEQAQAAEQQQMQLALAQSQQQPAA